MNTKKHVLIMPGHGDYEDSNRANDPGAVSPIPISLYTGKIEFSMLTEADVARFFCARLKYDTDQTKANVAHFTENTFTKELVSIESRGIKTHEVAFALNVHLDYAAPKTIRRMAFFHHPNAKPEARDLIWQLAKAAVKALPKTWDVEVWREDEAYNKGRLGLRSTHFNRLPFPTCLLELSFLQQLPLTELNEAFPAIAQDWSRVFSELTT